MKGAIGYTAFAPLPISRSNAFFMQQLGCGKPLIIPLI